MEYSESIDASEGAPSRWIRIGLSAKNNSRPPYFKARIQEIEQIISLDFIQSNITYDELSLLEDSAIEDQVQILKEDMLQVEYPDGFLLDAGWFPSFDAKGRFQIKIIKNHDWDSPISTFTAHSIDTLGELFLRAHSRLRQC